MKSSHDDHHNITVEVQGHKSFEYRTFVVLYCNVERWIFAAKFGTSCSNRCRDISFYRFSKWVPTAVLNFQKYDCCGDEIKMAVVRVLRESMRYTWCLGARCAWNRSNSFENMRLLILCEGWKRLLPVILWTVWELKRRKINLRNKPTHH